jgi:hypothetical protein
LRSARGRRAAIFGFFDRGRDDDDARVLAIFIKVYSGPELRVIEDAIADFGFQRLE